MNGFTHERDIRFPDTKANILLRGGVIDRDVLKSATNSTITMAAHFGVAKRINDVTALEVMVGNWHPVMCGDTDTLHKLYCMCDDEHRDHHEEVVVVTEPEYVQEEIKQTQFNYSEPEIDEITEEVEEIIEEEQVAEDPIVEEEITGQETIEEVVEEATSEEAVETEEETTEDGGEPAVITEDQDMLSEVFVTGMTTSIDRPTVEVQSNTVASTTTSVNVNNQNQGNARRQVNISNNHNAKRRHR